MQFSLEKFFWKRFALACYLGLRKYSPRLPMPKGRLEFTIAWFLAWYLSHYTQLTLYKTCFMQFIYLYIWDAPLCNLFIYMYETPLSLIRLLWAILLNVLVFFPQLLNVTETVANFRMCYVPKIEFLATWEKKIKQVLKQRCSFKKKHWPLWHMVSFIHSFIHLDLAYNYLCCSHDEFTGKWI